MRRIREVHFFELAVGPLVSFAKYVVVRGVIDSGGVGGNSPVDFPI